MAGTLNERHRNRVSPLGSVCLVCEVLLYGNPKAAGAFDDAGDGEGGEAEAETGVVFLTGGIEPGTGEVGDTVFGGDREEVVGVATGGEADPDEEAAAGA